jgi:hypothetical protein
MAIHLWPDAILVIPSCSVKGGVTRRTLKNETVKSGAKSEQFKEIATEIEDTDEMEQAQALAQKVRLSMRGMAQQIPHFGYVSTKAREPELRTKRKEILDQVMALNSKLKTCVVEADILLLEVRLNMEKEAAEMVRKYVYDQLTTLQAAIAGGAEDAGSIYNASRNLVNVTGGVQSDAIRLALDEARQAIKAKQVNPTLNALETAISMYEKSSDGTLPEEI